MWSKYDKPLLLQFYQRWGNLGVYAPVTIISRAILRNHLTQGPDHPFKILAIE